jgi:hypothetical protein
MKPAARSIHMVEEGDDAYGAVCDISKSTLYGASPLYRYTKDKRKVTCRKCNRRILRLLK